MRRFLNYHRDLIALTAVLFGVAAVMLLLSPERFLTPNNLRSMAFQLPEIGILFMRSCRQRVTNGLPPLSA